MASPDFGRKLSAGVGLLLLAASAHPATVSWIGGDGNFSNPANWSGGHVPGSGGISGLLDVANINTASPVNVTYDLTDSFAELTLGLNGAGAGQYDTLHISSTGLTVGLEQIGYLGAGAVVQSGGSNLSETELRLGQLSGDLGSYTLTGGSVSANQKQYIGEAGTGIFTQSGGTNTAGLGLQIGYAATGNGSYALSGTGTLTVVSGEDIGFAGTGSFTQTGGFHYIAGSTMYVGDGGTGTVMQSGGVADIGHTQAASLVIGQAPGGNGSYTLNGTGSLTVEAGGQETIGAAGSGTFNQGGGTHSIAGNLVIGDQTAGVGAYNLSLGSLSAGNQETVGNAGSGTFTQSGGTHTSGALTLGFAAGSSGTYNLSGGTMTSASEIIGFSGTGIFNQTGGLHDDNVPGGIIGLGYQAGSSGTYNLSGGTLTANQENVGVSGAGSVVQTDGSNTAGTGGLSLGTFAGSSGQYTLSGSATLSAYGELIGSSGAGTFTQTGGVNTIQSNLNIAAVPGSAGTYNLSGGTLSVGGAFIAGGAGTNENVATAGGGGVLNISGTGVLNSSAPVLLMNTAGTALNFSGGTINAPAIYTGGHPSLFNWTGGTLNVTSGGLILDSADGTTWTGGAFGPALTLSAGQTLQVDGPEDIGTVGGFALTLNDGSAHTVAGDIILNNGGVLSVSDKATLSYATLTQAGGTINGTLQNTTTFTYERGQFNGRLVNLGNVNFTADFTAGNGMENDTNLAVTTGHTLTMNGAGLDNFGFFAMTGGRVNGDGPVINDVGGLMQVSGAAAVNTAFTNYGQLSVNGSLTLSTTGVNYGVTTLAAGGGIRGLEFLNEGTLNLNGGGMSSGSTVNLAGGIISGSGGIGGSFANEAGGIIQAASGNVLTIANGWSNAGLVTMSGGTLGGAAPIANSGVIQGSGIIGGAIANTGTVRASGGELDVAGAGSTNLAGAQIQAQSGATILYVQGLAENDGTIALAGGTFDNANAALVNTGNIVGAGTVRTGGLVNQGNMSFADAATSVHGAVTTESAGAGTGNIQVTNNTTTFYDAVTLGADTTFTVTGATARFLAGFTNNGTYISDPSTSTFLNLTVGTTGALEGEDGDLFEVSGNLVNQSTEDTTFNLGQAEVEFTGANAHLLDWSAADEGDSYDGFTDDFAVGTLELAAGGSLTLEDGSGGDSGGLYVGTLLLDGAGGDSALALQSFILTHLVNSSSSSVVNIYYDPLEAGNAYLDDQTYALGGGGVLAPVEEAAATPEPRLTGLVFGIGIAFTFRRRLIARTRRRHL